MATLKKTQKLVFKTNYRLMQVKSIAECSKGSILQYFRAECSKGVIRQYFRPSLSYQLSLRHLFCLLLSGPGCVAQSVTCLATDESLPADPGVASSIPARSHTFVEIDYEIISTVILHSSAESFKTEVCCQLQAKVCA